MITEVPKGTKLGRFLNGHIFRDKDISIKYEISPILEDQLQLPSGGSLLLQGPKEDLRVAFELDSRSSFGLNALAPEGTRLTVKAHQLYGAVDTDVDEGKVEIFPGHNHRELLVYSLLHGIARLGLHKDRDWHESSTTAHSILHTELFHLQAYERVRLPEDPSTRREETIAWEFIGHEERRVSEAALISLKAMLEAGADPYPKIKTCEELARKLVNNSRVLRTAKQIQVNPFLTEKHIGVPMTLEVSRVRELVGDFYK